MFFFIIMGVTFLVGIIAIPVYLIFSTPTPKPRYKRK
jgi:hypothetical protein